MCDHWKSVGIGTTLYFGLFMQLLSDGKSSEGFVLCDIK